MENTNEKEYTSEDFDNAMRELDNTLCHSTPDPYARIAFLQSRDVVKNIGGSDPESGKTLAHGLSFIHQIMGNLSSKFMNTFYDMLTNVLTFIRNAEDHNSIFTIISRCADTYISLLDQKRWREDGDEFWTTWERNYHQSVISLMQFLTTNRSNHSHEWELLSHMASRLKSGLTSNWVDTLSELTAQYTNSRGYQLEKPNPYPNRIAVIHKNPNKKEGVVGNGNIMTTGVLLNYSDDFLTIDMPGQAYTIRFEDIRALISI